MTATPEAVEAEIRAYLKRHQEKELLRILTCGSVDDGKSTLIGRLLFDSKLIYDDQLAALRKDSVAHGTTGGDFDPALLTDGLKAEREQGITIDVAYRYFSTDRRKFIIADTPGHEQYTRNMVTGASNCQLAIILVDARHGVQVQTRRHSFIASLLGIKHLVVAVNKMDLVGWSEERFNQIRNDYLDFSTRLDVVDLHMVPVSALKGDNIVDLSANMPWYPGPPLLHHLETVAIAADQNMVDFRFPVQSVFRPSADFRGYAGTVASGMVREGEEVMVLPSGKRSRVARVERWAGAQPQARAQEAVVVTLADQVDVARGDMLARPGNMPRVTRTLEAHLMWMSEEALVPGKEYVLKHTTRSVAARVTTLRHAIDVNSLHRRQATTLGHNEIGRATITTAQPLMVDSYRTNRATGAFILMDRLDNTTVAAGLVLDAVPADEQPTAGAPQVFPTQGAVTQPMLHQRMGQQGCVVWFTGLSGSGKSTLARALEKRIFDQGGTCFVLDGDNVRTGLCADLGFSAQDREENIRRVGHVAELFRQANLITLVSFISPFRKDRQQARGLVPPDRFVEVHVQADLATCEARDTKGLYRRARAGEIKDFTGISAPYEEPTDAEVVLDTAQLSVDQCVDQLVDALKARGLLAPARAGAVAGDAGGVVHSGGPCGDGRPAGERTP